MCTIIDPDIIVASLFVNKLNEQNADNSVANVRVSLDECMKVQTSTRAFLGAVKAHSDKKSFQNFMERHKALFEKKSDEVYELNSSNSVGVEKFKSDIKDTVGPGYPKFIMHAFGFN